MSEASLFDRAEALGVFVAENDWLKLLNAIHEHEARLMTLRHDVQKRIAGVLGEMAHKEHSE